MPSAVTVIVTATLVDPASAAAMTNHGSGHVFCWAAHVNT